MGRKILSFGEVPLVSKFCLADFNFKNPKPQKTVFLKIKRTKMEVNSGVRSKKKDFFYRNAIIVEGSKRLRGNFLHFPDFIPIELL